MIAQNLVTAQKVASYTPAELAAIFPFTFAYGAEVYRVEYESQDVLGNLDTLSGLICFPSDTSKLFPRAAYMHGTVGNRNDVPSNQNGESNVAVGMAGFGYTTVAPDYPGLGTGRGFHPYVHARSEGQSGVDLIRALAELAEQENYLLNDQLFITGYSQGGHGAMSMLKLIEEEYSAEFTVTAAAPMSGPYSISGVMLDNVLDESIYFFPAYMPNVVLSMQTAYGDIYTDLNDVFKPEYVDSVQAYFNEQMDLFDMNDFLIAKLTELEGASIAIKMFQDAFITDLETNPNNPLKVALQKQDVDNWKCTTPTRMFYCTGDDQVPFENSIIANEQMDLMGSTDTDAEIVGGAGVNHGGCFGPAFFSTRIFFGGFQQILSATNERALQSFKLYPNPTNDNLKIEIPSSWNIETIKVSNIFGQIEFVQSGDLSTMSLGKLTKGIKLIQLFNQEGQMVGMEKVIVE